MDLLLKLHRRLQKFVDLFGIRPLARWIFRQLYTRCYPPDRLMRASQNGREWMLVSEVALRGELAEFETIEWLRQNIRPGMTVFDVGANVGQMTLEMAYLVGPTGKVVAIEPAPGNLHVLRIHIAANGFCDRVVVVDAACSDIAGQEVEFVVFGGDPNTVGSGHHMRSAPRHCELAQLMIKTKTVTVDSLSDHLQTSPSVLKIDVEGAEAAVLQGARSTLAIARPEIRVAFHPFAFENPEEIASGIKSFLVSLGYMSTADVPIKKWGLTEYVFSPIPPT